MNFLKALILSQIRLDQGEGERVLQLVLSVFQLCQGHVTRNGRDTIIKSISPRRSKIWNLEVLVLAWDMDWPCWSFVAVKTWEMALSWSTFISMGMFSSVPPFPEAIVQEHTWLNGNHHRMENFLFVGDGVLQGYISAFITSLAWGWDGNWSKSLEQVCQPFPRKFWSAPALLVLPLFTLPCVWNTYA